MYTCARNFGRLDGGFSNRIPNRNRCVFVRVDARTEKNNNGPTKRRILFIYNSKTDRVRLQFSMKTKKKKNVDY